MRPLGDLPPLVAGIMWGGALLFLAVQLSLYVLAGVALPDSILLAALLAAMPALALAQLPLMAQALVERVSAYWGSIVTIGILGTFSWLVGTRSGGLEAIGLSVIPWGPFFVWTVGLTLAGLATIVVFRQIGTRLSLTESPLLRTLLPRTGEERSLFALLSIAAGVGEEVAYRGYAIPLLIPIAGPVGAVAITSVVFGVLHTYQGATGIFRTSTMGAILAWGFLASGSLIPSIVAHTLIDIIAGIVIAERLLLPQEMSGVDDPVPPTSQPSS